MSTNELRKQLELNSYDELYRAAGENSSGVVRRRILDESERAFEARLVELARGKRVLEIGCGDGRTAVEIARCGGHVTAVDISSVAIERTLARAAEFGMSRSVTARVMDIERLEFPAGSFDLIVDREVLSSVDPQRVIPELARVLVPCGAVLGIESLGSNPVFNLNRTLGAMRGARTKWAVAHVVTLSQVATWREYFQTVNWKTYHVTALFGAPLLILPWNRPADTALSLLKSIDRWILSIPMLERFAFKTVFELHNPRQAL